MMIMMMEAMTDINDYLQAKMSSDLKAGESGEKPVKKSSIKEKVEKQIKLWGNKWKIHSNKLIKKHGGKNNVANQGNGGQNKGK